MGRLTIIAAMLAACGGTKQGDGERLADKPGPQANPVVADSKGESGKTSKAAEPTVPAGENLTEKVKEMNSDKFGRPPTKFRKGHVTKRRAPKVRITKTGFEVRFGSHAPIVTPAVYQNTVYVSGGFRSKEFHAFNATTGKSSWSVGLDDDGPSSAVCADGVCVFNTESCTTFAVNSETGKQMWSWWLGDPLTSSPTIANGRVFTSYPARGVTGKKPRPPGATHALVAFDLKSGKILWQKWLDSDVMSAPVATGEFVYVTTFAGTLIKLEQKTGNIRYAVKARATSAPVVSFGSDGLESAYYTRRGEAKDEADGAEEMIIRTDHNHPKTKFKARKKKAKYLDNKVQKETSYSFEGAADDKANGFGGGAPASANPDAAYHNVGQASVATMQAFQGSRILHMGGTNVNTMGDEVVATSADTGKTLWSYKLKGNVAKQGGFLGTAPLSAGDSVFIATLKGNVVRLDPKTGKVRATFKVGAPIRSQPVVSGGWIYVGTQDGRLVAINTGDKSLTGWPMWGGDAGRTGIKLSKRR